MVITIIYAVGIMDTLKNKKKLKIYWTNIIEVIIATMDLDGVDCNKTCNRTTSQKSG